jgi:hypothetical protein
LEIGLFFTDQKTESETRFENLAGWSGFEVVLETGLAPG